MVRPESICSRPEPIRCIPSRLARHVNRPRPPELASILPRLFSYGTLQQPNVQLSTFGRCLAGEPDELIEFEESLVQVDPEFAATSGKTHHAIVRYTGNAANRVQGTVFELTEAELTSADAYEPVPYRRVRAQLASGRQAWVYADSRFLQGTGRDEEAVG